MGEHIDARALREKSAAKIKKQKYKSIDEEKSGKKKQSFKQFVNEKTGRYEPDDFDEEDEDFRGIKIK